jgi:hypothetical protein
LAKKEARIKNTLWKNFSQESSLKEMPDYSSDEEKTMQEKEINTFSCRTIKKKFSAGNLLCDAPSSGKQTY